MTSVHIYIFSVYDVFIVDFSQRGTQINADIVPVNQYTIHIETFFVNSMLQYVHCT